MTAKQSMDIAPLDIAPMDIVSDSVDIPYQKAPLQWEMFAPKTTKHRSVRPIDPMGEQWNTPYSSIQFLVNQHSQKWQLKGTSHWISFSRNIQYKRIGSFLLHCQMENLTEGLSFKIDQNTPDSSKPKKCQL